MVESIFLILANQNQAFLFSIQDLMIEGEGGGGGGGILIFEILNTRKFTTNKISLDCLKFTACIAQILRFY